LVEMGDTDTLLSFEQLDYSTEIGTNCLSLPWNPTDSAAAATCISSGQRVRSGRLNVSKFQREYETLLEYLTNIDEGRV
ncbi:alkaline phosphatase, partial [Kipferlia bialata]